MKSIRYRLALSVLLLFSAILAIQFANLMLFAGDRSIPANAKWLERGAILDRNGRTLAIQTQIENAAAWKPDIIDPAETARILSPILNQSERAIYERLISNSSFAFLKRGLSEKEIAAIEQEKSRGALRGISLQSSAGRIYPERSLAAALIGYIGVDRVGLAGIEYTFENSLSPREEDGNYLFGNHIFLTIDINIQHIIESIGMETLQNYQAESVSIIVLDARNGELLGGASLPSFDPNHFTQYTDEQRRNLLISSIYEPGSVFKVFSIASFLQLGGISPDHYFDTSSSYRLGHNDFVIRDLGNYGALNPAGIIKYSSNVGAAFASETVSPEDFYQLIKLFGFGEETNIDLAGEEQALLRHPSRWSARSAQTIAIGQEIAVTPIQIVSAATVFSNNGILLRPQIIHKIVSPSGITLQQARRHSVRKVLSPQIAELMLRMMRGATEGDGTARRAAVEGINVSAKTGTAEIYDQNLKRYSETDFLASCLVIAPTEDPAIIIYVAINKPKGENFYGGRIAAPVVSEIITSIAHLTGIRQSSDQTIVHSGRIVVEEAKLPPFNQTIPDLIGLPKRVLLPLLRQESLSVQIIGNGRVARQSLSPGTAIVPGMSLKLELE